MFTLRLYSFSPISRETHVVACALGFLAFWIYYFGMLTATVEASFTTAVVIGFCWYVFKFFDGLEYDGASTILGPLGGVAIAVTICALYFLY